MVTKRVEKEGIAVEELESTAEMKLELLDKKRRSPSNL